MIRKTFHWRQGTYVCDAAWHDIMHYVIQGLTNIIAVYIIIYSDDSYLTSRVVLVAFHVTGCCPGGRLSSGFLNKLCCCSVSQTFNHT